MKVRYSVEGISCEGRFKCQEMFRITSVLQCAQLSDFLFFAVATLSRIIIFDIIQNGKEIVFFSKCTLPSSIVKEKKINSVIRVKNRNSS